MGKLDGRVAIVTGGAQGLGAAYARGLAKEGARVAICDVKSTDATVGAITAAGGQAMGGIADVSDSRAVSEFVNKTVAAFGGIQILVNNAAYVGTNLPKALSEISSEEWDRVMAVNTRGAFECVRAVLPIMRRQHYGKIINATSSLFFSGGTGRLHYIASKGALVAITRALARELGDDGIAVNAIAPGLTLSDHILGKIDVMRPSLEQSVRERSFKRDEQPEDLVGTVVFLASAGSDFMTGQTLIVDGGAMMH